MYTYATYTVCKERVPVSTSAELVSLSSHCQHSVPQVSVRAAAHIRVKEAKREEEKEEGGGHIA